MTQPQAILLNLESAACSPPDASPAANSHSLASWPPSFCCELTSPKRSNKAFSGSGGGLTVVHDLGKMPLSHRHGCTSSWLISCAPR
eukprot:7083103-Pyramimonas_sp.AAC.1